MQEADRPRNTDNAIILRYWERANSSGISIGGSGSNSFVQNAKRPAPVLQEQALRRCFYFQM
jgi:hypothetical protein